MAVTSIRPQGKVLGVMSFTSALMACAALLAVASSAAGASIDDNGNENTTLEYIQVHIQRVAQQNAVGYAGAFDVARSTCSKIGAYATCPECQQANCGFCISSSMCLPDVQGACPIGPENHIGTAGDSNTCPGTAGATKCSKIGASATCPECQQANCGFCISNSMCLPDVQGACPIGPENHIGTAGDSNTCPGTTVPTPTSGPFVSTTSDEPVGVEYVPTTKAPAVIKMSFDTVDVTAMSADEKDAFKDNIKAAVTVNSDLTLADIERVDLTPGTATRRQRRVVGGTDVEIVLASTVTPETVTAAGTAFTAAVDAGVDIAVTVGGVPTTVTAPTPTVTPADVTLHLSILTHGTTRTLLTRR